jgi:hypothetical protein
VKNDDLIWRTHLIHPITFYNFRTEEEKGENTGMEQKGQFTKVEKSEKPMYGPRGLLVCGYTEEERTVFLDLVDKAGLAGIRVVFASSRALGTSVGDLLNREGKEESDDAPNMPRAVIMSGLTQNELHNLMAAYRKSGFPRQLWAALTPVSEGWPLEQLLIELETEDRIMKSKGKG